MKLLLTEKQELNFLKEIYDSINDYILCFNKQGLVLFANKKFLVDFNDIEEENLKHDVLYPFLKNCSSLSYKSSTHFLDDILNNDVKKIVFNGLFHNIYYEPSVSVYKEYYIISLTRYNKEEELGFITSKINVNPIIVKLIDKFPLPLFYKNRYGVYTNCNQKFVTFFGLKTKEQIVGKNIYDFENNSELAAIYEQRDSNLIDMGESDKEIIEIYEFAYSFDHGNGTAFIYKSLYTNESGEIEGIVGVIVDTTQQKNLENTLRDKNFELSIALQKDHLTQIQNKLAFDMKLYEKVEFYSRYPEKGHFLLMILDIDHFKVVNDTYGHKIGDEVLKVVSSIISNLIRKTDMFFRIGGEEFALIIDGINLENSKLLAEKILKTIQEHKILNIDNKNVTISIGIAEFNVEVKKKIEERIKTFFQKADSALYAAKNNGRNQFKIFEEQKGEK